MDSSDLNEVFVSNGLELLLLLHQLWKLDVDRCSQGSSKVGWARSDITEMVIVRELGNLLNGGGSSAKSIEDLLNASSWLHGDNSELILFVNPHKEGLSIIVEDASA